MPPADLHEKILYEIIELGAMEFLCAVLSFIAILAMELPEKWFILVF